MTLGNVQGSLPSIHAPSFTRGPGQEDPSTAAPSPSRVSSCHSPPHHSSSSHACSHPGRLSTLGLGSGYHPDCPLPALETSTVLLTQQVQGHKTFPKAEPSNSSPTVTVTTVPVTVCSSPHVQLRPPPRQAPGLETSLHQPSDCRTPNSAQVRRGLPTGCPAHSCHLGLGPHAAAAVWSLQRKLGSGQLPLENLCWLPHHSFRAQERRSSTWSEACRRPCRPRLPPLPCADTAEPEGPSGSRTHRAPSPGLCPRWLLTQEALPSFLT